ncbi:MAG: metal ABC transporter permease [Actinomycetota bacterium]
MQRAFVSAALIGLAAPAIGVFLVQRRLALMGDGIGHVAFTGVAAGFLTGTSPVLTAVIAAALGAVVIEMLRERGRTTNDVALALLFYGGIAGGVLLTSLSDTSNGELLSYLFGSVVTVTGPDVVLTAVVTAGVLAFTHFFRKRLFAVCYDEEVALAQGLQVRALNLSIAILAAVTIAVTMRVVGILLVAAMLVLPVAGAQQLTRSFRGTVLASLALGAGVSVVGLGIAFYADVYPAATIVLLAIAVFAVASFVGKERTA